MRSHFRIVISFLITLGGFHTLFADPSISVVPISDQPNTFRLQWNSEECTQPYISNVGRVSTSKGEKIVKLSKTTSFTLFAQTSVALIKKTATAIVTGQKGIDDSVVMDFSLYKFPVSFRATSDSYLALLEKIHMVLQDNLRFSVEEVNPEHQHLFVTHLSERPDLKNADGTVGMRRIAFLVTIDDAATNTDPSKCEIRAFIQYRKRIESTWRIEPDESMYRGEIDTLRSKIQG